MASKFFTIAALLFSSTLYGIFRLREIHNSLSLAVSHQHQIASSWSLAIETDLPSSVSMEILGIDTEYLVFIDTAEKAVPASSLQAQDEDELLTSYLRHNFLTFSNLPQAYILWFMANATNRKTFDRSYISRLDFKPGDLLTGMYKVARRELGLVECSMSLGHETDIGYIDGRLIFRVCIDVTADLASFSTRTFMWRRKTSPSLMPMERLIPKWLHTVTTKWLIDSGSKRLMNKKAIDD